MFPCFRYFLFGYRTEWILECLDGMEHWPGHERTQITDKSKDKGKPKERRSDSIFWQWPHLEYGTIGSTTLVSKGGRVRWSTLVDTCHNTRWLSLPGKPVKVFPETRSPLVNINEHSARQRAEKGLQYLRAYFPDADFPGELVENTLEADTRELRCLEAFDPLLGNLLEIIPSHQFQNEHTVVFPMGELGGELNISRLGSDKSGNMVFIPARSPSFVFETPILQISSAVRPSQWISTPSSALLIRTHTSSSLLRVESSKVTQELDITRSETGDIPISDSRILASGPDIVVVNRSGDVYKCNIYHGGKSMQLVRGHEVSDDDYFWQLSVTGRNDECFLASCKAVKHIDFRSESPTADVFSLEHPSTVVTSFESPVDNYISHITTTSDIIWLDDRFRRRPLLSYKHCRSFDRTLRTITANCGGASLSLLTSRRNGLVSLYDVSRGTDGLLHCNSNPSCLPHAEPVFMTYDGDVLVPFPSDERLIFLRLCRRGSIYRQDIGATKLDEDQLGSLQEDHITHQWDEDILALEKRANELQTDFGPAGERHFSEVNLRGAYEKIFAIGSNAQEDVDRSTFKDALAQLPDVWQNSEKITENMLTTSDVVSSLEDRDKRPPHTNSLVASNIDPKDVFDVLMHDYSATQKHSSLAQWHYNIQDTSIPVLNHRLVDCASLHEYLQDPNLVSEVERHDTVVQRETEAREQLVLDLGLSTDVFSTRPLPKPHPFAAGDGIPSTDISYSEEPPEVTFGYFRPVHKIGGDHYADKEQDRGEHPGILSPLGVRLLLAEWELGTDPKNYTYRDPYGVADIDAQPIPEYRKLPTPQMTQKRQVAPQRPPLVVAAATQPPAVQTIADQREMVRQAESQQSLGFLEEPMASTQVLPGRFGGRQKAGKKRIGGF